MANDPKPAAASAPDSPQNAALKANKANLEARVATLSAATHGDEFDNGRQLELAKAHLDEVNKALGAK